jgi:hypothetical protein
MKMNMHLLELVEKRKRMTGEDESENPDMIH